MSPLLIINTVKEVINVEQLEEDSANATEQMRVAR